MLNYLAFGLSSVANKLKNKINLHKHLKTHQNLTILQVTAD